MPITLNVTHYISTYIYHLHRRSSLDTYRSLPSSGPKVHLCDLVVTHQCGPRFPAPEQHGEDTARQQIPSAWCSLMFLPGVVLDQVGQFCNGSLAAVEETQGIVAQERVHVQPAYILRNTFTDWLMMLCRAVQLCVFFARSCLRWGFGIVLIESRITRCWCDVTTCSPVNVNVGFGVDRRATQDEEPSYC